MADFMNSGGDDIDFDAAASAFPDISLDGEGDVPSFSSPPATQQNASAGFSFDSFSSPPPQNEVKVTGDDEIEKFEDQFPDIDAGPASPPVPPSFGGSPAFAPQPQQSAFASTPVLSHIEQEEPEVIRQWREKQAEEIAARDEKSKARKQQTISDAEQSMDDFYQNYGAKTEKNIASNKEEEEEHLRKLSEGLSNGTTWERICEMVELQNSQSKTIARTGTGTTDLTRFKEVLLRLKREGSSAPGAAGY